MIKGNDFDWLSPFVMDVWKPPKFYVFTSTIMTLEVACNCMALIQSFCTRPIFIILVCGYNTVRVHPYVYPSGVRHVSKRWHNSSFYRCTVWLFEYLILLWLHLMIPFKIELSLFGFQKKLFLNLWKIWESRFLQWFSPSIGLHYVFYFNPYHHS